MPSLSFTSLDRLIESSNSSSSSHAESSIDGSTTFYFHPPLYATPPQQRPPSPSSSFSPSPYVVNFKRRGLAQKQHSERKGNIEKALVDDSQLQQHCQQVNGAQHNGMDGVPSGRTSFMNLAGGSSSANGDSMRSHNAVANTGVLDLDVENNDSFLKGHRESAENNMLLCDGPLGGSLAGNEDLEFFDAPESVNYDSASEDDMNFTSLKSGKGFDERTGGTAMRLEEEILKRMKAEANVLLWEKRWNEMVKRCASLGISIGSEADNVLKGESEALEMLNQELVVARLVAGAIARAVVRVEKDEEFESMLGLKNREISRLWDKLQYLELVNREMSQRNLEVTESNQRRKKRRQRRQKLAINTFCAALLIGTAGLACYTYVPWDKFKIWDTTLQQSTDI